MFSFFIDLELRFQMNVTTEENSKFARFSELWERLSQGDGFDRVAFFFIKTDVSALPSRTLHNPSKILERRSQYIQQ